MQDSQKPKVVVIGLDGGTFSVVNPLLEAGKLPNLHKIVNTRVHGVFH